MKYFKKAVFFNYYHLGDIHVSQEFVKWFIKEGLADKYEYWHKAPDRLLLASIREIMEKPIEDNRLAQRDRPLYIKDDVVYINTWYGVSPSFRGISSCTLQTLYDLFTSQAVELEAQPPALGAWAIPNTARVAYESLGDMLVVLCNCPSKSEQAIPSDFHRFLPRLLKEFPEAVFFFTNLPESGEPNPRALYADKVFGTWDNLHQCAMVADHAQVIIGNSSGPYTYALNQTNLMDLKKTFLCFCKAKSLAQWAGPIAKCQTIWSPLHKPKGVEELIVDVIRRRYQ